MHLKRFFFAGFLVLFFILPAVCLHGQQSDPDKSLRYEVSVRAQLVPIFAVDSQGNPVFDLKQEEIQLYVDGKPFDIIFFKSYQLKSEEEQQVQIKSPAVKLPERINFIIIDTLISNKNTMEPARAIVWEIIKRASTSEVFVILESNQITGFQYVVGPEKNKKKLSEALEKIEKRYMQRRVRFNAWMINPSDPPEMTGRLMELEMLRAIRERQKYQGDVSQFAHSLQQLKYALKTTPLPKTVYLISAGHMENMLGKNPITYLRFLEDAAKAVNYGGSLFYLINPLKQNAPGKGTALKFMSDAVGGKFISDTSIPNVVSQIKKNTSAYYELAFYPLKESGQKSRVQLKCKRKEVQLTTINYSEKGRPYHLMQSIEKKMFVLNIVNGGSWSRMVAPVKRVKYEIQDRAKAVGNPDDFRHIEVAIPPGMRNRKLHLYLVEIDANTQKADLGLVEKTVGEKEMLSIRLNTNKKQYFVFIEPSIPTCIYNRVM